MTNTQIVGIGVRLFAVWLVVYVLRNAPALWLFGSREIGPAGIATVITVSALMVVIAAVLWFFPLTVARKLIPESLLSRSADLPREDFQRMGFCLLGLWVLAEAIPLAVRYGYMLYHALKPNSMIELGLNIPGAFIHAMVQLAIGVWLLFGAKGLLGVLRKARHAGR